MVSGEVGEVQAAPKIREQLEQEFSQVWDTRELARDFIVIAYSMPLGQVKRKTDGVVGNLNVQERPCSPKFSTIWETGLKQAKIHTPLIWLQMRS